MTTEQSAQARSVRAELARQLVGACRYVELCRKEDFRPRPEVGGSRLHRQDCRRVSGSSQRSTGEAADQESVARASSDRAGRHELHHNLAYGGIQ
jgi:hypothetical protein